MRRVGFLVGLAACVCVHVSVAAQQRPLETHDPRAIGAGDVMLEAGFAYVRDRIFPVSGLRGHLTTVPRIGIALGVGGVAEIRIDHVSFQHLRIVERLPSQGPRHPTSTGDTTSDVDDLSIGAKTRFVSERGRRPDVGFQFSTRLPNAGTESGLGLDTMDFQSSVLLGKTMGPVRLAGNIGVAILGDPTTVARQNDVLIYGVSSVVSVFRGLDVVAEINGRHNTRTQSVPPGTDSSALVRGGVRVGQGNVRLDGAMIVGIHDTDPAFGGMVGVTWTFSDRGGRR